MRWSGGCLWCSRVLWYSTVNWRHNLEAYMAQWKDCQTAFLVKCVELGGKAHFNWSSLHQNTNTVLTSIVDASVDFRSTNNLDISLPKRFWKTSEGNQISLGFSFLIKIQQLSGEGWMTARYGRDCVLASYSLLNAYCQSKVTTHYWFIVKIWLAAVN